jgi:hypothetical protein
MMSLDYGLGQTNIDKATGIRYGVISGNSVPEVMEDIYSSGEDLQHKQMMEDLKQAIHSAVCGVIEDIHHHPEKVFTEDDAEMVLDGIVDGGLWDHWESDGDSTSYELEDGDLKLGMSSLGGAPLIWIYKSPWVVPCEFCSPCVPGAGDLDNAREDGPALAYCLAPDEMPEDVRCLVRLADVKAAAE